MCKTSKTEGECHCGTIVKSLFLEQCEINTDHLVLCSNTAKKLYTHFKTLTLTTIDNYVIEFKGINQQLANLDASNECCMSVIVDNIFKHGVVNWGRVIALIAFYCYSAKIDYEKNCDKERIINMAGKLSLNL